MPCNPNCPTYRELVKQSRPGEPDPSVLCNTVAATIVELEVRIDDICPMDQASE